MTHGNDARNTEQRREDAMQYMILLKAREDVGAPPPELMAAMGSGIGELMRSGTMLATGTLRPSSAAARVRLRGDRVDVTDGPFTEATEVVGGYAIVRVDDHREAVDLGTRLIELHKEHWPGWEGEAEVRQMAETHG
jgi:hypothetical protein